MDILKQIEDHLARQPEPKRGELRELHRLIRGLLPTGRLWFLDGRDAKGKVVSNPNIGYGFQTLRLAKGKTKDFYQIGLSANTTGMSVYILGIADKDHLARSYGKALGKAKVTGYCIKFKSLKDINLDALRSAIRDGIAQTRTPP